MAIDATRGTECSDALLYDIHGLRAAFWSDAILAGALQARLEYLSAALSGEADLTFTFCSVPAPVRHVVGLPSDTARTVYRSAIGEVRYDEITDILTIMCGDRVRLRGDPARGQVLASIAGRQDADLWLLSHPLVTLPLMELAKRRGLFSLHAAGAAIDGRCLIFPGTSGSGKSTLALALARGGWDMLGDDLLFLAPDRAGVQVCAFPEAIDVTDQTIGLFTELQDLGGSARLAGWPKRQLHLTERYGTRIAWKCQPAALIFPRVAPSAYSVLTPLDRDEALLELVPNVLLTEARATQSHLDALGILVGQSACYRLETGRDLDALPALFHALIG